MKRILKSVWEVINFLFVSIHRHSNDNKNAIHLCGEFVATLYDEEDYGIVRR